MVAVATVTTSSFGQPPRSCLCIGLRSIFATALAARFPGFGVGDRPSVVIPTHTTGCHHRAGTNRRDHRYWEYPSIQADLINYIDQMCINYRDRSQGNLFAGDSIIRHHAPSLTEYMRTPRIPGQHQKNVTRNHRVGLGPQRSVRCMQQPFVEVGPYE